MSYSYSDAGDGQSPPPEGKGRLVVVLPHWAATASIYNYALERVGAAPSRIAPDDARRCHVEVNLSPGVYEVEAALEGKCARLYAIVRAGQTYVIRGEDWKGLELLSAAPLDQTATTRKAHAEPAEEFSRRPTWASAQGGASGLFVFVRTLEPKKFRFFAEGLRLLSAEGEPVVDLEGAAVVKDARNGWMAFNAELPPGYYVLRKGRSGVRPRHQPVYLCPGWQTQVFIAARWTPSLATMTVNMSPPEKGFSAADESAMAAEAVLDGMRRSASGNLIFDNEKINALVKHADRNPWLGIVAAYALRGRPESGQESAPRAAERAEALSLVTRLLREVSDHPDVRALSLDNEKEAPIPIPYPPMLRAGLKIVQRHAMRFTKTVPPGSLTDCLYDDLLASSQWTAWRRLEAMPGFGQRHGEASSLVAARAELRGAPSSNSPTVNFVRMRPARREPEQRRTRTTAFLQSTTPSLPVYRLESVSGSDVAGFRESSVESSYNAPATVATVLSTPLFQFAETLLSGGGAAGDMVTLDFTGRLAELFSGFTPREVSAASGLPLSRVREGFDLLKHRCENATMVADWKIHAATILSPAEQAVFEYALRRDARLGCVSHRQGGTLDAVSGTDAPTISSKPVSIEECLSTLSEDAERLSNVRGSYMETAAELAARLKAFADNLQRHADFLIITDLQGRMLYGNGVFVRLITGSGEGNKAWAAFRKALESALSEAPHGRSELNVSINGAPGAWRLRRITVADRRTGIIQAYMNVLRVHDVRPLTKSALGEVKKFLSELSLHASLLALGNPELKTDYLEKLKALVASLEQVSLNGTAEASTNTHAPQAGVE